MPIRAASQSSRTITRWRTHQVARDFIAANSSGSMGSGLPVGEPRGDGGIILKVAQPWWRIEVDLWVIGRCSAPLRAATWSSRAVPEPTRPWPGGVGHDEGDGRADRLVPLDGGLQLP